MIRRNIIIRRVIVVSSSKSSSSSIMDKEAIAIKRWDILLEAQEVEVNFIIRNIRTMEVFPKRRRLYHYILLRMFRILIIFRSIVVQPYQLRHNNITKIILSRCNKIPGKVILTSRLISIDRILA